MKLISFFKSFSLWDWADLISLCMVFFGVWFNHIAAKNKSPRADFWEGVLIVGLMIEVITLPRRVLETSRANERAAKADAQLRVYNSVLFGVSLKNPQQSAARLSEFSGVDVDVVYFIPDNTSHRDAGIMLQLLTEAKWRVTEVKRTNGLSPGSMHVIINGFPAGTAKLPEEAKKVKAAAMALCDELEKNDVSVWGPLGPEINGVQLKDFPPLHIVVTIPPKLPPSEGLMHLQQNLQYREYVKTNR